MENSGPRRRVIKALADYVREDYGTDMQGLEMLAHDYGVQIILSDKVIEPMLYHEGNDFYILSRKNMPEKVQLYAISHELGHYMLAQDEKTAPEEDAELFAELLGNGISEQDLEEANLSRHGLEPSLLKLYFGSKWFRTGYLGIIVSEHKEKKKGK